MPQDLLFLYILHIWSLYFKQFRFVQEKRKGWLFYRIGLYKLVLSLPKDPGDDILYSYVFVLLFLLFTF